jgi:DNA-binding GntR family transcriptional regulator
MSELNGAFHARVLAIASSSRLTAMLASLVQLPLVQRTFAHYDREALERSARHHLELVAALEAGDAGWAEVVMRAHVHAALATLRPQLATQPAG